MAATDSGLPSARGFPIGTGDPAGVWEVLFSSAYEIRYRLWSKRCTQRV
jgi:hypothetical protein